MQASDGRLLTWADAKLTQSLADGELPIPTVVRDHGDLRLTVTAFARGEEGHSVVWARYRVENRSAAAMNAALHLAIRPLQVNPSWQFLATPGGAADITSLEQKENRIVVNDATTIVPVTALESFRAQKNKSVDAKVTLGARGDRSVLEKYQDELADLFIVSAVAIAPGEDTVAVEPHTGPRCERCWKHYDQLAAEPSDVCVRCAEALKVKS